MDQQHDDKPVISDDAAKVADSASEDTTLAAKITTQKDELDELARVQEGIEAKVNEMRTGGEV